jgi:AbrB family looped-hinge helix DNA binding protein
MEWIRTVIVSSKGQIAIPKDIRERLQISDGDRLDLEVAGEFIRMRKQPVAWRCLRGSVGTDLLAERRTEKDEELRRER